MTALYCDLTSEQTLFWTSLSFQLKNLLSKNHSRRSLLKPGSFRRLPAPSSLVRLLEHFCLRCHSLSSFFLHCRMQASLPSNWRLAARLPISFATVKILIFFSATESCILLFFPSILIFEFKTQLNVSDQEKAKCLSKAELICELSHIYLQTRKQQDGK